MRQTPVPLLKKSKEAQTDSYSRFSGQSNDVEIGSSTSGTDPKIGFGAPSVDDDDDDNDDGDDDDDLEVKEQHDGQGGLKYRKWPYASSRNLCSAQ